MNAYSGKRFCVLSNSVSTYEGYTPASAVFYDAYYQSISGVTSVNDTWWMQVINRLGGVLGTMILLRQYSLWHTAHRRLFRSAHRSTW